MRPDIDFVVEVLGKLAEPSVEERLRNGQRVRAQVAEALNRGEVPTGNYRFQWMNDSVKQLMELLQMMADDFNKSHPDDLCTVLDLLDILGIVDKKLRKKAEEK